MNRQVFTDESVLDAAKHRISRLFDDWQNIIVSISGGKDSTVLAHLVLSEAHRRDRKVGIFFLDEEVVTQSTIDQVDYLMGLFPENTIKYWLQFEFHLTNATSLNEPQILCWEAGKHKIWMRPRRDDAIKAIPWPAEMTTIRNKDKGFGFYDVLDNFERWRPDTCFMIGLRAVESPNRWRAVASNPGYGGLNWTTNAGNGSVRAYPLYDWNTHDIWRYIYDAGIRYSKMYDMMNKKGYHIATMRTSSLLHEKSFKCLVDLPEFEPKTFNKLLKRVKGVQTGHLYGKDARMLKCRKRPDAFKTWKAYRDFLLDTYPDPEKKEIFERRFKAHLDNAHVHRQQCRQLVLNDYENNLPVKNEPNPFDDLAKYYMEVL